MGEYWIWRTSQGDIAILRNKFDIFELKLCGVVIGTYPDPESALQQAVLGLHEPIQRKLRTSDLQPPQDLSQWGFVPSRMATTKNRRKPDRRSDYRRAG
jgi:hypothetical protein